MKPLHSRTMFLSLFCSTTVKFAKQPQFYQTANLVNSDGYVRRGNFSYKFWCRKASSRRSDSTTFLYRRGRRSLHWLLERFPLCVGDSFEEVFEMGRPVYPYELADPDFSWLITNFQENFPEYSFVDNGTLPVVFIGEKEYVVDVQSQDAQQSKEEEVA